MKNRQWKKRLAFLLAILLMTEGIGGSAWAQEITALPEETLAAEAVTGDMLPAESDVSEGEMTAEASAASEAEEADDIEPVGDVTSAADWEYRVEGSDIFLTKYKGSITDVVVPSQMTLTEDDEGGPGTFDVVLEPSGNKDFFAYNNDGSNYTVNGFSVDPGAC